jgi:acyl dehydratase
MRYVTDRSFPFPLAGLLHVENRIEQSRPILLSERPSLSVTARDLRPHPRGLQFDVVTTVSVGGRTIWRERSAYLRKGGARGPKPDPSNDQDEAVEPTALWRVPNDIGRRYAAVSGDRNPIHLSRFTARLFGQRRPIAHGMWLAARCLSSLEGRLPGELTIDVEFERPVPLGSTMAFVAHSEGHGWRFWARRPRDGRPCVSGWVR